MRRLVLLSSLATVGLGITSASAQYTYSTGGYRNDAIMASEPDAGPRPYPRNSSYDAPVESQALPSLNGTEQAPYDGARPQAMPSDSLPPSRDSAYGQPPAGQNASAGYPAQGQGQSGTYNNPYQQNGGAYQGGSQSGGYQGSSQASGYPGQQPYQGGGSYSSQPPAGGYASGGQYPGGQYQGGQSPNGQYQGGQYSSGSYDAGPRYGANNPDAPRPPASVDGYRPSYSAAPGYQGQPNQGQGYQGPGYQGQAYQGPTNLAPGMNNAPSQQRTQIAALPPEDQPEIGERKELPPQFRRQVVQYKTKEPAGTIVIDTPSTFLYYVNGDGTAVRYGIGVGRDGFTWKGTERVTRMAEWPDWHPPAEMIERQPYLPRFMAGGESNPMGARALYLGKTVYRIHGTNQPSTIGQFVSSGCIRMLNEDVEDLYTRVKVGTKVVVMGDNKPGPTASNTQATR